MVTTEEWRRRRRGVIAGCVVAWWWRWHRRLPEGPAPAADVRHASVTGSNGQITMLPDEVAAPVCAVVPMKSRAR